MMQAEQVSWILSWLNRSADCTCSLSSIYVSIRWLHSTHRDLDPLLSKAYKPIISTSTDITSSPPNQLSLENTPNSKMLSIALRTFFLTVLSVIVAARNLLGQSTSPHQQPIESHLQFFMQIASTASKSKSIGEEPAQLHAVRKELPRFAAGTAQISP
jgi:hypothetical protein